MRHLLHVSPSKVRFAAAANSETFIPALRKAINLYMETQGLSPFGGRRMAWKVAGGLGLWAVSYALLISGWISTGTGLVAIAFLHGFTHLFIAFNIGHDANHGAISADPRINRLLSYSYDLIGVSSLLWRRIHNSVHHVYANVEGEDDNLDSFGLMRLSPGSPRYAFHRFQHLYWPLVYGVATLNYVLLKDLACAWKLLRAGEKLRCGDCVGVVLGKVLYISYAFVLPLYVLDLHFWQALRCFLAVHAVIGNILGLVIQSGHLTEAAQFETVQADGRVNASWHLHAVESACNYARHSPLACWLFGGLNLHIVHHLAPRICHVHYPALAPIVHELAQKHGLRHCEIASLWQAFASHIHLLRRLGAPAAS